MIWTIIVILLILYLCGFVGGYGGNAVHTLLVIILILVVCRLLGVI